MRFDGDRKVVNHTEKKKKSRREKKKQLSGNTATPRIWPHQLSFPGPVENTKTVNYFYSRFPCGKKRCKTTTGVDVNFFFVFYHARYYLRYLYGHKRTGSDWTCHVADINSSGRDEISCFSGWWKYFWIHFHYSYLSWPQNNVQYKSWHRIERHR